MRVQIALNNFRYQFMVEYWNKEMIIYQKDLTKSHTAEDKKLLASWDIQYDKKLAYDLLKLYTERCRLVSSFAFTQNSGKIELMNPGIKAKNREMFNNRKRYLERMLEVVRQIRASEEEQKLEKGDFKAFWLEIAKDTVTKEWFPFFYGET